MDDRHYHFFTGRLAEHSLRRVVTSLSESLGFAYTIDVLPITVAALMTPPWIARKARIPPEATDILLPGYCDGDLGPLVEIAGDRNIKIGPRDLRRLPDYFGQSPPPCDYGRYRIEIVAEINHCPRLSIAEILATANAMRRDGADVIDVGCEPGGPWLGVADVVAALKDAGHRVSIDSLDSREIEPAIRAGAELVLSVNSSNRERVADLALERQVEVVAVPDDPKSLAGFDETIEFLASRGVEMRLDPILEPIGFGFGASLLRFAETRQRYPDAAMMMGIGNLTELTDVDSAGVNVVLLALCEEWNITSVLTTQVINWAKSSVRECDIARRLVHHAIAHEMLPKHLEQGLLIARDEQVIEPMADDLVKLADAIRDNDYRIFALAGEVHLVGKKVHLHDSDPFVVMQQLLASGANGTRPENLDASHAFYLGYEMHKALTAIKLGKTYEQDESLRWGHLTRGERRHYLTKQRREPDAP